ncbi:hypothetical protein BA724_02675 [Domibacillus iocasae]|uniref:Uncharacterized protein n=1 Tax=Domibacillus iocasae TaxID=1714016 RepID=A0A1E7DRN2_9BACI|nr:hypothetical protein BA724_02675 [Domibacillus iocasae]
MVETGTKHLLEWVREWPLEREVERPASGRYPDLRGSICFNERWHRGKPSSIDDDHLWSFFMH